MPTRETTLLSLNLRKIRCYTPYNRQVLPTRRKTVRMNSKLIVEEDLQWKMFYKHGRITEIEWYHKFRIEWYHKRRNYKMKDLQGR
jgi:hypothetical protein